MATKTERKPGDRVLITDHRSIHGEKQGTLHERHIG